MKIVQRVTNLIGGTVQVASIAAVALAGVLLVAIIGLVIYAKVAGWK